MSVAALLALGLLLPLAGFVVNRLVGPINRALVRVIGPSVVALSGVCFIAAALISRAVPADHVLYRWAGAPDGGLALVPRVDVSLYIDPLAIVMTLVVTGVGFLIHLYSVGYMGAEDADGFARFFAHMNLFVFSMLLLVLAHNFVVLTVGWALVGLSSYLLIGFYNERPAAVAAARKAFVMNVIGDVGIVIASFIVLRTTGGLGFDGLLQNVGVIDQRSLEFIGLFLLVGAVAKSAQIPLHTWLPDAMEGPTPVSALIHAATMVTAGVYLVARMGPLFAGAPLAAGTAALIGVATALIAGLVATVQNDIKRVLAYSTMSQIGYMLFAVAIGAQVAGIFHLVTHAFFKALLFLSAGNVIHALHGEQDLRRMGGLWKPLRLSGWAFLVGALAMAGIPPLSGFFSKDAIIGAGLGGGPAHPLLGLILVMVAGVTAFYMLRAFYLAFVAPAAEERADVHEAPWVMLTPVLALAALATVGGLLQPGPWHYLTDLLRPAVTFGAAAVATEPGPTLVGAVLLLVIAGIALARAMYGTGTATDRRARAQPGFLEAAFFWDAVYEAAVVRPLLLLGSVLGAVVETRLVEGSVDGVARLADGLGAQVRRLQTGYLRSYAAVFAAGVVVLVIVVGTSQR